MADTSRPFCMGAWHGPQVDATIENMTVVMMFPRKMNCSVTNYGLHNRREQAGYTH
jgi:hypothetical protein